jgi:hypothetical protein
MPATQRADCCAGIFASSEKMMSAQLHQFLGRSTVEQRQVRTKSRRAIAS